MRVPVLAATDAAARDRVTIDAGVPSRGLMQRAGAAAAAEIVRRYPNEVAHGVAIYAGPGNNGGDAWVVAGALRRWGSTVRVAMLRAPKTDDARFEQSRALAEGAFEEPTGAERLIVDGILGTGARDSAHAFPDDVARINSARASGTVVVALDVPTGQVRADCTLTFGTLKQELLVARGQAGTIALLDIGLDASPDDALLVTAPNASPIAADAHKGTRGKIAIVGGAVGMAGATVLAGEAALRSGAGMVRLVVAPESMAAVQTAMPVALASPWPADDLSAIEWADVIVLGPGLGRAPAARALCNRVLAASRVPLVIDADAITAYADDHAGLTALVSGRAALLTPHPLEFARFSGLALDDVLAQRFTASADIAEALGAAVLLKGVPTVVRGGRRTRISATGTPALATAGSGDVLAGIAAALLVGAHDAADACERGAEAAWAHGRAAELATAQRGGVRGTTLHDVIDALADVWRVPNDARPPYPVLCELPAIPE